MSLTVALVVLALLLSCLVVMAFEVVYARAEMAVGAAGPIASVRTGIRSPLRSLGHSLPNRGPARRFPGSLSGKGPTYTGFLSDTAKHGIRNAETLAHRDGLSLVTTPTRPRGAAQP